MTIDVVLSRLSGVRQNASGWTADCPCHESKSGKSLAISQVDGRVLLHCWAGCKTEDILKAVGLSWPDLFSDNGHSTEAPPPKPAARPGIDPLAWWSQYCGVPADFLRTLPLEADGDNLAFTFGSAAVRKLRPSGGKAFSWQPSGGSTPALWPMPGAELPETVWLCEGESDTVVARHIGLQAYALTHGAGTPLTSDQVRELKRRGVEKAIVCFDSDKPGREGAGKLAAVLRTAGIEPTIVDLADHRLVDPLLGEKDLRDLWTARGDREAVAEMLRQAALEAAKPAINGQPPNLPPYRGLVVGVVCAADLKARPHREIDYLPFLDRPGYIPKGWSVLVAAYPKVGKTELMARLCGSWAAEGEDVLYVTEEPEIIWQHRLSALPGDWGRVRLLFGLGMEPAAILERIKTGPETIVVVDTVRNLLGLEDETDNSEVARVLAPYVAAAREGGKTLVLLHHVRKGGGEHGEGITGGHAFLGIVDVALEILRESNLGDRKRRVRGWGRLMPIDEIVYILADDGTMSVLGSPKAVELAAVKERLLATLGGGWRTRKELLEDLEEPKPAMEQLRLALNALVAEGAVERDPAVDKPGATYRYRLTQPHLPPTGYMVVGEVVDNKPNLARDSYIVRGGVATGPPRDAQDATVTPTEGGDTGCLADF